MDAIPAQSNLQPAYPAASVSGPAADAVLTSALQSLSGPIRFGQVDALIAAALGAPLPRKDRAPPWRAAFDALDKAPVASQWHRQARRGLFLAGVYIAICRRQAFRDDGHFDHDQFCAFMQKRFALLPGLLTHWQQAQPRAELTAALSVDAGGDGEHFRIAHSNGASVLIRMGRLSIAKASGTVCPEAFEQGCLDGADIDLEGASLHDFHLRHMQLQRVIFRNGHMRNITFEDCDMTATQMHHIEMRDVCFKNTDLKNVSLMHSRVLQCIFTRCTLDEAVFSQCLLHNTQFDYSSVQRSRFRGDPAAVVRAVPPPASEQQIMGMDDTPDPSTIELCHFNSSNLNEAEFIHLRFLYCHFNGISSIQDLPAGADAGQAPCSSLVRSQWLNCALVECQLNGLQAEGIVMTDVSASGCQLERAVLDHSQFDRVSIEGCHLKALFARGAHWHRTAITGTSDICSLQGAGTIFSHVYFRGSRGMPIILDRASLCDAKFHSTLFSWVHFGHCAITNTAFDATLFAHCQLQSVNFSGSNGLDLICGADNALPEAHLECAAPATSALTLQRVLKLNTPAKLLDYRQYPGCLIARIDRYPVPAQRGELLNSALTALQQQPGSDTWLRPFWPLLLARAREPLYCNHPGILQFINACESDPTT